MDILKALLLALFLLPAGSTWAKGGYDDDVPEQRRKALAEQKEKNCESTAEYIKVLGFMRDNKDFVVTETAARQIADRVSKGCTGAASRFSRTLTMLKKIGISDRRALVM